MSNAGGMVRAALARTHATGEVYISEDVGVIDGSLSITVRELLPIALQAERGERLANCINLHKSLEEDDGLRPISARAAELVAEILAAKVEREKFAGPPADLGHVMDEAPDAPPFGDLPAPKEGNAQCR